MSEYGPGTFDTPEIPFEAVICEIIDNSIAANANKIHLRITNDEDSDGLPSMKFEIFDNGTRIQQKPWTEADIEKAFVIEYDPLDPPDRQEGEVGKFHVGMKIATLSMFEHVSMITRISDEEYLQRHGRYPSQEMVDEDVQNRYGGDNNPSPVAPTTVDVESILEQMKEHDMTTWVGTSTPRVQLLYGAKASDQEYKTDFIKNLRIYLGITYQLYLEDNDFELTLGELGHKGGIIPLDPFWENFSVDKLKTHALTLPDGEKKVVMNLSRFGTIAQDVDDIEIDGERFSVQGFIIPHGSLKKNTVKSALKEQFPNLRTSTDETVAFSGGIDSCGSSTLKSSHTGGFYFYRGKRCINFGGSDKNQHGFMGLKDPITSTWATRLRIKIKYTDSLDNLFVLHPNKNGFKKVQKKIMDKLKTALSRQIGGTEDFVKPFNTARPFCTWSDVTTESQFDMMLGKKGTITRWTYTKCTRCTLKIHETEDYCDIDKCGICDQLANENGCNRNECKTGCPHCSTTGEHQSSECPDLLCDDCDDYHTGECATVDDDDSSDEGDTDEGDTDEQDTDEGDTEEEPRESTINHNEEDNSIIVDIYVESKDLNIAILKEILEVTGISPSDLE